MKLHKTDPEEINLEPSIIFLRTKTYEDKSGTRKGSTPLCKGGIWRINDREDSGLGAGVGGGFHSSPVLYPFGGGGNHSQMSIFTS